MACSRTRDDAADDVFGTPLSLFVAISCLAIFGIIYSTVFVVFNVVYRNDRYKTSLCGHFLCPFIIVQISCDHRQIVCCYTHAQHIEWRQKLCCRRATSLEQPLSTLARRH